MTDTSAPAHVPTEDDTLTTGPDEGFSMEAFTARVIADKYQGHEVDMAHLLSRHAMARNTRRWAIVWDGEEVGEDNYTLDACSYAQDYTGFAWGVLNLSLGVDIQLNTKITQGLIYGMLRDRKGMDDKAARAAVGKLTPIEAAEVLIYRDGEQRPKAESDQ